MSASEASWDSLETMFKESYGNYNKILGFSNGLKYLKLRTISKKNRLIQIANKYNITGISGLNVSKLLKKIFLALTEAQIENFIRDQYNKERLVAIGKEDELFDNLKKLNRNDWGGVRNNQLEYHIVNNYVKKISNYDDMKTKIDNEIKKVAEGWSLSNWYSFWANKVIESQINDHAKVLPGIGEIEHIDFFWDNIPFDLKTTKFAQGFIEKKRAEMNLDNEFKAMKKFARENQINVNLSGTDNENKIELMEKLSSGNTNSMTFIKNNIFDIRNQILQDAIQNPREFAIWNYENQSEKRFGDENRFFLILVDKNTTEESWKLKREKVFITSKIKNFLDAGPDASMLKDLPFRYQNRDHKANCCILFIVEE